MEGKLISRRELAVQLGVHYSTVFRWSKTWYIKPHCFVGKNPRYLLSEVLEQFSKGGALCQA
jgi:transposase